MHLHQLPLPALIQSFKWGVQTNGAPIRTSEPKTVFLSGHSCVLRQQAESMKQRRQLLNGPNKTQECALLLFRDFWPKAGEGSKVSAVSVDGEAALQQVCVGVPAEISSSGSSSLADVYKQGNFGNFGNLGKQACPTKEMHCRELEEKTPKGPENLPEYSRTINRT